jgi:ribonuclease-3
MHEGRLTRLRASLVRTETLLTSPRSAIWARPFAWAAARKTAAAAIGRPICAAGSRPDIGAIYLDQGLEAVRAFVLPSFESALETILTSESDKDAKSLLQEWSQATLSLTPTYRTVEASGPDHAKEFTVDVFIGDRVYGRGSGRSKQAAAQDAAQTALAYVQRHHLNTPE